MAGTLDRLMQIQARAAAPAQEAPKTDKNQHKPTRNDTAQASTEQKESILQALSAGSTTGALALSLQAIGAGDPAFLERATQLMQPAAPGEAWRMAFRTFEKRSQEIERAAAQADPAEAALPVFQAAAQECAAIYNTGSIIAQEIAMAVYEALDKTYKKGISA